MKETLIKGDYVLATKYSDGMSDDSWGVGFYDKEEDGRHYVKDLSGISIRLNGFRRCEKIKPSTGTYIFQNQDRMYSAKLWKLVKELERK